MTTLQVFFSILSPIIYLIGFVLYIYHTFRGKVVPHVFSWTIWAILSLLNTVTLWNTHPDLLSAIGPTVRTVALLFGAIVALFFISRIRIGAFDIMSLVLATMTIAVAHYAGVEKAIIATILIDILVLLPTLRKIWRDPDTEDASTWFLVVLSQGCYLLSLSVYTLENSLFWAYVMSINALVAIFIIRRRVYTHRFLYRLRNLFH